jgi:peptide/nickel transport system permease protein
MLGNRASVVEIEALRHELGFDKPILVQYGRWLWNCLHGDLGKSLIYHEDVGVLMMEKVPITFYLAFLSITFSTFLGIFAGVISAVKRGDIQDTIITLFANTAVAIPTFWLGLVGIYIFGLELQWLPIQGWTSPFDDFWLSSKQLILPVFALSVPNIAIVVRQTRSSMLETIRQDYIRTATSKGLRKRIVLYKHALRNALIPVVTIVGVSLVFLFGGQVLVETVFNIPGLGRLLVRAALDKDFLIVQGSVLIIGATVCLVNMLVDITYGWIDPRIRYR